MATSLPAPTTLAPGFSLWLAGAMGSGPSVEEFEPGSGQRNGPEFDPTKIYIAGDIYKALRSDEIQVGPFQDETTWLKWADAEGMTVHAPASFQGSRKS